MIMASRSRVFALCLCVMGSVVKPRLVTSQGYLRSSSANAETTAATFGTAVEYTLSKSSQVPFFDYQNHSATTAPRLSPVKEMAKKMRVPIIVTPAILSRPRTTQHDVRTAGVHKLVGEDVDIWIRSGSLLLPQLHRAFILAGKTPDNYSISQQCALHLSRYYIALAESKDWAWNMYDSTGKQGAGVFSGALGWPGNLEQCLLTPDIYKKSGGFGSGDNLTSKFCSAFVEPPKWVKIWIEDSKLPSPVTVPPLVGDVCTVSTCTEQDIQNILQKHLINESGEGNLTVITVKCYRTANFPKDVPSVVAISVISLLIILALVGTVYDVVLRAMRNGARCSRDIPVGTESIKCLNYPLPVDSSDCLKGPLTPYVHKNNAFVTDSEPGLGERHSNSALDKATKDCVRDLELGLTQAEKEFSANPPRDSCVDAQRSSPSVEKLAQQTPERHEVNSGMVTQAELKAPHPSREPSVLDMSDTASSSEYLETAPVASQPPDILTSADPGQKSPKSSVTFRGHARNKRFSRMQKKHLRTMLSVSEDEKSVSTKVLFQRILVTFSFRRNLTDVLGKGHADMLFCLNGVRVLSICWIVLGSFVKAIFSNPRSLENHLAVVKLSQQLLSQPLINTSLAADTFFILSGTLYAYNFMKVKAQGSYKRMCQVMSFSEYFWAILHRLFRIMPCYYLVIMIYTCLGPHLGVGEGVIQARNTSRGPCSDRWWTNALFISNFYKADDMCMPWTYYLINDFQFSLLSPLVAVPLLCYPALGFGLVGCLVAVQVVSVTVIGSAFGGNIVRMTDKSYFSQVYVKPYCRVGVYAVGLALGYLLHKGCKKTQIRKVPLCVGWSLCLTAVLVLPYITYLEFQPGGRQWSGLESSVYEAVSRPLWALAVSWVIFTCCIGQGGFISKFLSWNLFIPMCRITYGVYLLHPIVIESILATSHNKFTVTFGQLTLGYISNLVISWCLALVMIILVQQPFVGIEAAVRRFCQNLQHRKVAGAMNPDQFDQESQPRRV